MTELGIFVPAAERTDPSAAGVLPEVRRALLDAVYAKYRNAPRSQQTAIGPSQVGHPCGRYLAFMASGRDRTQQFTDPWPSIVGTAVHSWLGEAIEAVPLTNDVFHEWVSEQRVQVGAGLGGSADAYHVPSATVVDFKVLGDSAYREIKSHGPDDEYWTKGPGQTYYTQLQCYGLGFANTGRPVRNVSLAVFGRAKPLSAMFLVPWTYRPEVAEAALERLHNARMLAAAGVDPMIVDPKPDKKSCYYCPFRGREADGLCESGEN